MLLGRGIGILAHSADIVQDLSRADLLLPGNRGIRGIKDVLDRGRLGISGLLGQDLAFVGQVVRGQHGERADLVGLEDHLIGGQKLDEQDGADGGSQEYAQHHRTSNARAVQAHWFHGSPSSAGGSVQHERLPGQELSHDLVGQPAIGAPLETRHEGFHHLADVMGAGRAHLGDHLLRYGLYLLATHLLG